MNMPSQGISFIVAGRLDQGGAGSPDFKKLDDIEGLASLPLWCQQMFKSLEGFRNDISSTEIRAKLKRAKKNSA